MLYVTTRNPADAYTAHNALKHNFGKDGGKFVAFRLPEFSAEEISALKDKNFNQIVAEILNIFFSQHISGWDLDFNIGRNLIKIVPMNHRIVFGEVWHNLDGTYEALQNALCKMLTQNNFEKPVVSDWSKVVIRIAAYFGLYGEMCKAGILEPGQCIDVAVLNDDMLTPMAAKYCKQMGLPINTIICSCENSSFMWDFIHKGVLSTAGISDGLLSGIERLLLATLGANEVQRFINRCESKQPYSVSEEQLPILNNKLFCAVAGKNRTKQVINSVYRTNSYIIDSNTALCYSGLQDFRAKNGESSLTLILAENYPMLQAAEISEATGISADKLTEYID